MTDSTPSLADNDEQAGDAAEELAETRQKTSTTAWLFDEMLERIRAGRWPVGSAIPSERTLIGEFNVSRIALREALSMLRSLGVLETTHGRSSIVRRIDSDILARLFPLMLSLEGPQTFANVFEIRLAIEAPAAALAALRRTQADMARLEELSTIFQERAERNLLTRVETDLALHQAIARAAQNPLFEALLGAISGYVIYVQTVCCKDDVEMRHRAVQSHAEIVDAIRERDAERARSEMEVHLRFTAARAMAAKSEAMRPWDGRPHAAREGE